VLLLVLYVLLQESYTPYLLRGTDSYLGQNVGLISRLSPAAPLTRSAARVNFPVPGSHCGSGRGTKGHTGVSKHFRTVFKIAKWPELPPIAVYGVHLKAIPTQAHACHKREAQAKVIQGMVAKDLKAGMEVIIMGDFNDFDASPDARDASNSKPTSRVLRMLTDIDENGQRDLFNLVAQVPKKERYSDWWSVRIFLSPSSVWPGDTKIHQIDIYLWCLRSVTHGTHSPTAVHRARVCTRMANRDHAPKNGKDDGIGEHSELDHFLVTKDLLSRVRKVWIDHTHNPADVSDHWPIMAEFHRKPQKTPEPGASCGGVCKGKTGCFVKGACHEQSATVSVGVCQKYQGQWCAADDGGGH
jgi:endonuclease/exonuclease/phosphatase family metal-dependent hydrolase